MGRTTTEHKVVTGDSCALDGVAPGSVDLVVTSPPYPMIEMWDQCFGAVSSTAKATLDSDDGWGAFEAMHRVLDQVWARLAAVVRPGGFVCINIGDATRSIGGDFALYPNHARISQAMQRAGFTPLPVVLWRKQTNAPNKFMGSGMLPAGAYVTLEHEYVLVFRMGGKRVFAPADKPKRSQSAFFWEERNQWFSDVWDFKGARQSLNNPEIARRSAAYPFELPYRLISMYSAQGDTVLDPFNGSGTTTLAAMATGRNSVGFDIDPDMAGVVDERVHLFMGTLNARTRQRLLDHVDFVVDRTNQGKPVKHHNALYNFPVMTRQETELVLLETTNVSQPESGLFVASHQAMELGGIQVPLPTEQASNGSGARAAPRSLHAWAE